MPNVSFYLNHNKTDQNDYVPILLQFTDKGSRFRMYTGEKIPSPPDTPKKFWNSKKQRVSSKYISASSINDVLDDLEERVTSLYREEKVKGKIPSVQKLKSLLEASIGNKTVNNDVVAIYQQFIDTSKGLKTAGTIKNYRMTLAYLQRFSESTKYPLDFDAFDSGFYEKLTSHLINKVGLTNNTVGRIIKNIKAFLNWCTDKKYNTNLDYKKFKVFREDKEVIYLTSDELYNLFKHKPETQYHERVKDLFCFGCFTGLRISDLKKIAKEDISNNEIKVRVQKTKDILSIPLLPEAQKILKKYDGELPKISEQKINSQIKLICKVVGINETVSNIKYQGSKKIETKHPKYELITTHIARKTFVTLCLEKGIPPQVVMSITGHKDYKTMKPYIKVADKIKKESLLNAWK